MLQVQGTLLEQVMVRCRSQKRCRQRLWCVAALQEQVLVHSRNAAGEDSCAFQKIRRVEEQVWCTAGAQNAAGSSSGVLQELGTPQVQVLVRSRNAAGENSLAPQELGTVQEQVLVRSRSWESCRSS